MISIKSFAFQGVYGAYSEQAGKNVFPDAKSVPCSTFEDMFSCVKNEKAEIALVPIENSQAGRVADTQRLIPDSDLNIIGEYFLEVDHNLLAIPGTKIIDIKRIHSHEQGIAQCRNNIIKLNKEMIIGADTAGSAKKISELKSKEDAAIASALAADIYNLEILESNFQDSLNNVTRFLVMSKNSSDIKSTEKNLLTTLVFVVRSIPASLYKCLGGFASNGVNITKLESYIHPQGFDVAQFYIDFEGHPDQDSVKLALEEMKFFCKEIKILGVYKKSEFRKK
ncbi:MAG: prephenate dehydratase [Pelagibacteraceae bacterium]|jgi:prephenate dehydratase|nr:prephenate dehydratase [Pelagibacteraceae bacterium]MBT3902465.1 prephenate dehydratase [Pelagibacteraceae bacterium]MBT4646608.1 prephenate dehydratase [Pelagibacteraceae bacterium]MBT4950835.1 prephenate dehydratase [Pelagibacteraceae bacterium]MBT5214155.1 prephenate dehydratase [Pelagibacteraceae bacterium]